MATSCSAVYCCDGYETRHGVVLCERIVYFTALSIPFENVIEKAFERKKLKYAELVLGLLEVHG